MSTNFIFSKIAAATTAYSLLDLQNMTYKDMITKFGLTSKEVVEIGPYHSGIKKRLVQNVNEANKLQAMNEMANKILLAGSNVTAAEAQIAVEAIFQERGDSAIHST